MPESPPSQIPPPEQQQGAWKWRRVKFPLYALLVQAFDHSCLKFFGLFLGENSKNARFSQILKPVYKVRSIGTQRLAPLFQRWSFKTL